MSPATKALLAVALTLPLVAFVAGVLAAPAGPSQDRTRPVIVNQVGDDTDDRRDHVRRDQRDARQDDDSGDRDRTDDRPVPVITPAPRDLDDDDGGVDDDGGDGDDDTTDDGREGDD